MLKSLGYLEIALNHMKKFKEKYNFPFELLSDSEEIACNLFDVIKLKKYVW